MIALVAGCGLLACNGSGTGQSAGLAGGHGGGGGGDAVADGGAETDMPQGKPSGMYMFMMFDGPGDNAGGTTVNAISESGDVLGFSSNADGSVLTNFIRARSGSFTTLDLGDPGAMAIGINAAKVVVGATGDNAFSDRTNAMNVVMLPPALAGKTMSEAAFGINNGGMVVGQYTRSDTGASPGFLLADGKFTDVNPTNAQVTNAQGINNDGMVVGFFATAAAVAGPVIADNVAQHGFLFDSATGVYTPLPDPQQPNLFLSQYLGINDQSQTVGYWQDMAGSQHGFRYDLLTKTFTFIDEPDAAPVAGVSVTQVVGINNGGDIAGFFIDANGVQHGFFATPR
jgi:hypothetical protein